MTDEPETRQYRLRDDVEQVIRSGLILRAGETIELEPTEAEAHSDVLVVATEGSADADADVDAAQADGEEADT